MLLIPKVVHRIWFGPNPMPADYVAYEKSWERHGYEVKLWNEGNLPPLRNQAIYDDPEIGQNRGGGIRELGRWVQRADLVSYELIARFGGIYANTDMECLRPLDGILDGVEAFAGFEQENFLGCALMGCVPDNAFFNLVIEELPERWAAMPGRNMEAVTGPHLLSAVRGKFPDAITQFPAHYFYPYLYTEMERETEEYPDSYCAHHWGHQRPLSFFTG